jgi:CRP/FNR family transcriptional regulator
MAVAEHAIAEIPYFAGLGPKEIEHVRGRVGFKRLEKGEIIFLEGEPCRAVYFVHSGRIKIYKTSPEGREQVLRIMKRGNTFNEVPVFDEGPNPATAQALERSSVLFVRKDDLRAIVREYPVVAETILKHFAGMLRHLTMLVEDLSFRHVTGRLAKVLVQHASEMTERGGHDGGRRLTQQELAALVGTAREVVGRSLRAMESAGAIRIEGHRIIITNRAVLEDMI